MASAAIWRAIALFGITFPNIIKSTSASSHGPGTLVVMAYWRLTSVLDLASMCADISALSKGMPVASATTLMPKYGLIAERIIVEIRKGRLPLGSQIPSEKELMSEYSVSTTTARKVLQELERVGWVTRIRGRGTFVRQQTVGRSLNRILSFTRNMVESGRVPSTKVLAVRVKRGARQQQLPIGQFVLPGPMYEVRRLRLADGVPMAIETRFVSMHLCPGLDKADLSGSLLNIYEQQYGLRLTRIDQVVVPTFIDEDARALLGVEEPLLGIRVEGVVSAAGNSILELEESLYRGDLYRFYVTATHY